MRRCRVGTRRDDEVAQNNFRPSPRFGSVTLRRVDIVSGDRKLLDPKSIRSIGLQQRTSQHHAVASARRSEMLPLQIPKCAVKLAVANIVTTSE